MNKTISILSGLAILLVACQQADTIREGALPDFDHILVIVGDDHGFATVGAYGNNYIQTPGLDRLAAGGICFEKAYATSPICSASRQSVLCGKYPHATGVNMLFTPFPDEGNITIAEHLRAHGFATAIIGKNHFNNWVWGHSTKTGHPTMASLSMSANRTTGNGYEPNNLHQSLTALPPEPINPGRV
jgi:arylsulfatase A-like enzyme